METIDDEVLEHALAFIDRQAADGTPLFCCFNTTHMHSRTHPKPESVGQAGRWQSPYHDTMIDHDKVVGALLDKLDALRLAENTIVV
jgi:arylsulfatase